MNGSFAGLVCLVLALSTACVEAGSAPSSTHVYRGQGQAALSLDVYTPSRAGGSASGHPVVVYFHGGGWKSGNRQQFARQAALMTAETPLVVITVDYPLNRDPVKATEAAEAAVCWVRKHARQLDIDPARVALAGGSAGGQLAAAVALVARPAAPECSDVSSPYANALLLYNPVLDLTGKWQRSMGGDLRSVSPLEMLHARLPPTAIFQGTADKTAPLSVAKQFVEKAASVGAPAVKLFEYKRRTHGFFNVEPNVEPVARESIDFLKSQGWF